MAIKNDVFDDRIFEFYQYLEYRNKLMEEKEKKILLDENYKQDITIIEQNKKQPIPCYI